MTEAWLKGGRWTGICSDWSLGFEVPNMALKEVCEVVRDFQDDNMKFGTAMRMREQCVRTSSSIIYWAVLLSLLQLLG
jgi:hypothetical protein